MIKKYVGNGPSKSNCLTRKVTHVKRVTRKLAYSRDNTQ